MPTGIASRTELGRSHPWRRAHHSVPMRWWGLVTAARTGDPDDWILFVGVTQIVYVVPLAVGFGAMHYANIRFGVVTAAVLTLHSQPVFSADG